MSIDKPTVLIIEDNAPLADALQRKLQSEDFITLTAPDGLSGLELATQAKPDLILLDVQMPVMNGAEMLQKLRADVWGATVPVILLSNDDNPETISSTVNAAGGDSLAELNDYLIKADTSLEQIVQTIRARLAPKA